MTSIAPFDVNGWFKANCRDGSDLNRDTFDVVASFTLMWNFFESQLCGNNANVKCFKRRLDRISIPHSMPTEIESGISFWRKRYYNGSEFNNSFYELNFRRNDKQEVVEEVLRGDDVDAGTKFLAVTIIIFRLRNNLFHGLKSIRTLNSQTENLTMSCKILAKILELSDSSLITPPNGS